MDKGRKVIRVLLFGTLSTRAGTKEIELEYSDELKTLDDVVEKITKEYLNGEGAGVYMLALNETQAKPDTPVRDNDEIAIMPPFSGG